MRNYINIITKIVLLLAIFMMTGSAYAAGTDPVTGSNTTTSATLPALDQPGDVMPAATIVNFDDIALAPDTEQQIINYAGITWDQGLPDWWGSNLGAWYATNYVWYATPKSPPNYVFNAYGAVNPGFTFSSPVRFDGAYFFWVDSGANPARVRFVGYVSGAPTYYSAYVDIVPTPTYLAADFPSVDRVVVEMDGLGWFGMDDLSYSPAAPQTVVKWSATASTGAIDEADLGIFAVDLFQAYLKASAPLPANLEGRYNVAAVDGVKYGNNPGIRVRYRDTGTSSAVKVYLREYNITSGASVTRMTFDSNSYPQAPGYQTKTKSYCNPPWTFDFNNKIYYVEASLQKTASTGNPGLIGIQLVSSTC